MTATAALLTSLDAISHETSLMLVAADDPSVPAADRRELKRRVYEIRGQPQELFEWLSESRLEAPRN